MKKQKLPSKDWIGLLIDSLIRDAPKDFLTRESKIKLRGELQKHLLIINSIIIPAYSLEFTLASGVVNKHKEDIRVQFEVRGYHIGKMINIELDYLPEKQIWIPKSFTITQRHQFS